MANRKTPSTQAADTGTHVRAPGGARRVAICFLLTWPVMLSGCAYFPWLTVANTQSPPSPEVFTQLPTLDQLVQTLNEQSSRVEQLQAPSATITAQGLPSSLPAELVHEYPKRIRLVAKTPIVGSGRILDLGSNDDMFWMFVNDEIFGVRLPGTQRTPVFVAQHDQFSRSAMHQMLPVEPHWMIESLGLVRLSPTERHEGPIPAGADQIELHSRIPSTQGELTRVLVIHARHGWVMEQRLYDPSNRLLATTQATKFRYYPLENVSLPHHVEIQLSPGQPTQVAFAIDVNSYAINHLDSNNTRLWSMPEFGGHPRIDLADPHYQQLLAPAVQPPMPNQTPPTTGGMNLGYRPNYRGLDLK